jgi:hypothetical protein
VKFSNGDEKTQTISNKMLKYNYVVRDHEEDIVGVLIEPNIQKPKEVISSLEVMLSEHHPEETIKITSEFAINKYRDPALSLNYIATSQNDFDASNQPYQWNGVVEMTIVTIYDTDYFQSQGQQNN